MSEFHPRAEQIFRDALDRPESERDEFVRGQCGDDTALLEDVRSLLRYHEQTGGVLDAPVQHVAQSGVAPTSIDAPRELPGAATHEPAPERIGAYRVIRQIGAGGMGKVYLAEQESPRREVALKVIRHGVVTYNAMRRFEHEAQVLARLQHPGIAQVYEAGTFETPLGPQPYFAMELIRGEPLTAYADRHKLGTRGRLALLMKICSAVHHAHTKGVIHRDLKPGNILVGEDGEPKVLDFGVARATDADIQSTTLRTDIGQLIGTVPYMSPEQAAGDSEQIDTRSDVYALGVVAYELLAGRLPYDLTKKMVHEAVRIIREEEPTRLNSINRTLRGDIEIIIGRALAKEKERRYQSANDLASDIDRYLRDEPIVARPPSASYQLGKFARRNKALVGGVAAVFLVLAAGLAATGAALSREAEQRRVAETNERRAVEETQRAEAEAARALAAEAEAEQRAAELEQVAEFQASQLSGIDTALMGTRIKDDILARQRAAMESAGAEAAEIEASLAELEQSLAGVNFTNIALNALDENIFARALDAIDSQFADQPLIRARLLHTVADTLGSLGMLDKATSPLTEALELRRSHLGGDDPRTLSSINGMGRLLLSQGKHSEAEEFFREALEGRRRSLGEDHPDTLSSIHSMGSLFERLGRLGDAESFIREALEGRRRIFDDEHPSILASIKDLGYVLQAQGKLAEAEPYYLESLGTSRRLYGDVHPETLGAINNMGFLLESLGRPAEAEPYAREALELHRRIYGDDHPNTLAALNNLGANLRSLGRLAEAEPVLRELLERCTRLLGEEHPHTLITMNNLFNLLQGLRKYEESEPYGRKTLEARRRTLGADHPGTITSVSNYGSLLQAMGRLDEAESYHREALDSRLRVLGEDHQSTLGSLNNLSSILREMGRLDEAESLGATAVATARRIMPEGNWRTGIILGQHALTLVDLQRFAEAEALALEAHAIYLAALGDAAERTVVAAQNLVDLYTSWHETDPEAGHDMKAAEWRAKLELQP